ncbi:D-alanyl-D-alanine carboxypeptidase [Duganella sp. Leaf126]|nr:D-alanyl-D-alanine carboxypeptidase [Duganella sp. Leaf126]
MLAALLLIGTVHAATLPEPVARLMQAAKIPESAAGIVVLRGDTVLLSHNAQQPMQPASTMKLFTTLTALDTLGPVFRGRTELRSSAPVVQGVLQGDLIVRGGADADFNEDVLIHMLQALRNQGITTIQGDVILDRTLFQPARLDLGQPPFDEYPWAYYNVIPDALLVNTNLLKLELRSVAGQLSIITIPELDNVTVRSDLRPVAAGCAQWEQGWRTPDFVRSGDRIDVVLHGSFPRDCTRTVNINVLDPHDYLARLLRATWRRLGGAISGTVREASAPAWPSTAPASAPPITASVGPQAAQTTSSTTAGAVSQSASAVATGTVSPGASPATAGAVSQGASAATAGAVSPGASPATAGAMSQSASAATAGAMSQNASPATAGTMPQGASPATAGTVSPGAPPATAGAAAAGAGRSASAGTAPASAETPQTGSASAAEAPVPTRLLAEHVSRALPEVLRDINKNSDNTLARTIFLSLGSLAADPLLGSRPLPPDGLNLTSSARAEAVIRAWLQQHRIDSAGLVLDNGSGLSRSERATAAQLAGVLQAGLHSNWMPEFLSSLPIAATDGTMRRRLQDSPAATRARIKTGSLNGVIAIAGYVQDANNQPLVVVAMLNDPHVAGGAGRAVLDALIDWAARQ